MKYFFQLQKFPNSNFEMETSIWTGKSKLLKDNIQIEQSKEKGKPFLIPNENGEILKAFPKQSFPDFMPVLEINGSKNQVVKKLNWFQYILGGLPFLLVFIGGAIGGAMGAVGAMINFTIFRQKGTDTSKYVKVIGVGAATFIIYFLLVYFILQLVN